MTKTETRHQIEELFAAWGRGEHPRGKWDVYPIAFAAVDARRITLREVIDIAATIDIRPEVLKMRRRDWLHTR